MQSYAEVQGWQGQSIHLSAFTGEESIAQGNEVT